MQPYDSVNKDWKKVDKESVEFMLRQAHEYERCLSERSDKITSRAFSIVSILATVATALIAVFAKVVVNNEIDFLTLYLLTVIVVVLTLIFLFGTLVFPRGFMMLGRNPKKMFKPELLGVGKQKKHSYIALLLAELEVAQQKIDFNSDQNRLRTKRLKHLMLITGYSITVFFLAFTSYLVVSTLC